MDVQQLYSPPNKRRGRSPLPPHRYFTLETTVDAFLVAECSCENLQMSALTLKLCYRYENLTLRVHNMVFSHFPTVYKTLNHA